MRVSALLLVIAAVASVVAATTFTRINGAFAGEHHFFTTNAAGDPIGFSWGSNGNAYKFDRLTYTKTLWKTFPTTSVISWSCSYDNNLFYVSTLNGRVYKAYDDGNVSGATLAFGTGVLGNTDGDVATATIDAGHCAVMANGDVYFEQRSNVLTERSIRKYSPTTGQITTVVQYASALVEGDAATIGRFPDVGDRFWLQHDTQEVFAIGTSGPLMKISSTGQISSTSMSGPICSGASVGWRRPVKPQRSDAFVMILCGVTTGFYSQYLQILDLTTSPPTAQSPIPEVPGGLWYGYTFTPDNSELWLNHRDNVAWTNAVVRELGSLPTTSTQDPAVAAFCDGIATRCSELVADCTTLRNGGQIAVADDCDQAVAACNGVHQECTTKAQSCPLV